MPDCRYGIYSEHRSRQERVIVTFSGEFNP